METFLVKKISGKEFQNSIVEPKTNAVVKLFTEWSGASQLLGFAFADLASQYQGRVDFYQVDIDCDPALSDVYRIELLPTLLFFRQGQLIGKLSGLNQRKTILANIDQIINPEN